MRKPFDCNKAKGFPVSVALTQKIEPRVIVQQETLGVPLLTPDIVRSLERVTLESDGRSAGECLSQLLYSMIDHEHQHHRRKK